MYTIKIKDIILEPSKQIDAEKFNNNFKGKYVYLINEYLVPMESISYSIDELGTLECFWYAHDMRGEDLTESQTKLIDSIKEEGIKLVNMLSTTINETETFNINNNLDIKYKTLNKFVPSGITVDDLRKFRTWLAKTLLTFETIKDVDTIHVLKYYAGGMHNEVVEALNTFGSYNKTPSVLSGSTCSCNSQATSILAQFQNISICDPLAIYRKNIYLKMIEIFSNVDFWTDLDKEFLEMFKLYIDGIIQADFVLTQDVYSRDFSDCTCQINGDTSQQNNLQILTRLSNSLSYMISQDTSGHRLYINSALNDWSTYLYENMEWS